MWVRCELQPTTTASREVVAPFSEPGSTLGALAGHQVRDSQLLQRTAMALKLGLCLGKRFGTGFVKTGTNDLQLQDDLFDSLGVGLDVCITTGVVEVDPSTNGIVFLDPWLSRGSVRGSRSF